MCTQLRQIYDKKSPIFLTEIAILVATIFVIQYASTCFQNLRLFYLIIIIVSGTQVFLKSIGLAIIHAINKQVANNIQTFLVGIYIIIHLMIWICSIIILRNQQFIENCRIQQPHYFFVNVYVYIYGVVILGSFALLIVLLIPVTALTLFSFKKNQQSTED